MSTRKRPLGELSQPPASQTPRRYAPSTPHAIRALQQRSGAKTRSLRSNKVATQSVRPDSARGILRRLAKITAPLTKGLRNSTPADKENEQPQDGQDDDDDDDDDEDLPIKRPRMTLDIDDSIEESIDEARPEYLEEEDSELPAAPTPSILPDDDGLAPTLTFKSIDFAKQPEVQSEKIDRRTSRISTIAGGDDVDDEEPTMLTERGRRAISEEATGRLSRYSFGSLRMSDFGSELEIRPESDPTGRAAALEQQLGPGRKSFAQIQRLLGEEEEAFRPFRPSLSRQPSPDADEVEDYAPAMGDDDFQLPLPADEDEDLQSAAPGDDAAEAVARTADQSVTGEERTGSKRRRLTELEVAVEAASRTGGRQKRVKMTKHGNLVPSLPSSLIKRVAIETQVRNGRRKPKLGRDHMKALEQATEWFFEQVGEDLEAYSDHARRKKRVDEDDVLMLMRRQRTLQNEGQLRKLAKHWLPRDKFAELDLPDAW